LERFPLIPLPIIEAMVVEIGRVSIADMEFPLIPLPIIEAIPAELEYELEGMYGFH